MTGCEVLLFISKRDKMFNRLKNRLPIVGIFMLFPPFFPELPMVFAMRSDLKTAIIEFEAVSNCQITIIPPEPWFSAYWNISGGETDNMRGYDCAINIKGNFENSSITTIFRDSGEEVQPPPTGYFFINFKCEDLYKDTWFMWPIGERIVNEEH